MRIKTFHFIVFALMLAGSTRIASAAGISAASAGSVPISQALSATAPWSPLLTARTTAILVVAGSAFQPSIVRKTGLDSQITNRVYSATIETAGFFAVHDKSASLGEITIAGHVINGSGGDNPTSTFVTLAIYENDQIVDQIKIPLNDMGLFEFDLVPWNPNYTYQASLEYNGIEFDSELIDGGILLPGALVHLSLPVYEVSTNAQFLEGMRMRVIYDFTSPGWVHVMESIVISNPTSLVIVASNDTTPILDFPLPKAAINVSFPDGNGSNRFRLTGDGFGDWQPVMPGDGHQMLVEYSVPFTNSWRSDLETPITLNSLMVMVKASRIVTSSNGLQLSYTQNDPGGNVSVYAASSIEPGGNISIVFSTQDQIHRIWLGIGFFTLTLFFALFWIIRSARPSKGVAKDAVVAENGENVDTILDAIIALDDRYRHGDIAGEAYQRARAEYIERLEAFKDHDKD